MIIEWLLGIVAGVVEWFGTLLPDWELPPEIASPDGMLAGIFAMGQGMAPFVDWAFVGIVGAIPLGVWIIGILWKLGRTIASHFGPLGGAG